MKHGGHTAFGQLFWRRLGLALAKKGVRRCALMAWQSIRRRNLKMTKGRCIEFIGPSGVGKTTLLNQVWHRTAGDWHSRKDIAGARIDRTPDLIESPIHWRLLLEKSRWVDSSSLSSMQKLKLMQYFTKILVNDVVMREMGWSKGFLLDEGLCHNFSRQIAALGETDFAHIMSGRALVFVTQRDDLTVARQIQERAIADGKVVPHHHGRTMDELMVSAANSRGAFEAFATRASAAGMPICIIHTEDPSAVKVRSLVEFEHEWLERQVNNEMTPC